MTSRFALLLLVTATAAAGLGTGSASAQSLFATRGLGYPMDPQDARSQGLGGVTVGLAGLDVSWANPGATFGLGAPTFIVAYQYDNFTAEEGEVTSGGSTARFPLMLGAFPAGQRLVIQLGFGTFLDQNWTIQVPDTLLLGLDTVPVVDWSRSEGGVTRLRLGATYEVIEGLGLGAGLDLYTGGVDRLQGRAFPDESQPACCRAAWDYQGLGFTAGLRWAPTLDSSVGASVSYGGTLEASPRDSVASVREYVLPLTFRGGASGRIGSNTLIALSGTWAGWSDLNTALEREGGAQNSWSLHGGVEWDALSVRERRVPLRAGARTATLPFRWDTGQTIGWAKERAFSLGAGVGLGGGAVQPDFSLELGRRGGDGAGIEESFWRVGFSVRVYGR